tara:strand:- start:346 stop:1266 length:921 start_codon:yes stop_codon:yes gene_type:complete
MIKIFIIFINIFLITKTTVAEIKTDIALKVNDKIITTFDIKNKILSELLLAKLELDQINIDNMKNKSLNSLIDLQLKKSELERYEINVPEIELDNYIKTFTKFEIKELKNLFISNNLDWDLFKDEMKTELLWRKFIFNKYNSKIDINLESIDNELNKFIENNKNFNQYRISEIEFLADDSTKLNAQVNEILQFINDNDFEKAVIKFSNSQSKVNQGDLGWIEEKSFSSDVLSFIKDLKKGELSKPLIKGKTITIFKLVDKKESPIKNMDKNSMRNNLINFKKNEQFDLYSNSHLSKLKNNSLIDYK